MTETSFGSDNHSGVHPEIMGAMVEANQGYSASYEQDPWSQELKKLVCETFNAKDCYMVFNGTAANVLSLQACLKSYEAVLCTDISHLNIDECGAPEKIAGCKLITIPSQNGKFIFSELEKNIFRKGDQHFSQCRMLSLTLPTEYGTLYSEKEVEQIAQFCEQHQLYLHIDGARLANAAVATNQSFAQLTRHADIISFGGAKNGLLAGELVIIRNAKLCQGFKFYRKQSLQLPSKSRFFAAAFLRYLQNNLWAEIASHENKMALYLAEQLASTSCFEQTQPVEANAVFGILPKEIIKSLRKNFFFYVWDENTFEIRLMTSFSTTTEQIELFVQEIKNLTEGR